MHGKVKPYGVNSHHPFPFDLLNKGDIENYCGGIVTRWQQLIIYLKKIYK